MRSGFVTRSSATSAGVSASVARASAPSKRALALPAPREPSDSDDAAAAMMTKEIPCPSFITLRRSSKRLHAPHCGETCFELADALQSDIWTVEELATKSSLDCELGTLMGEAQLALLTLSEERVERA